MKRARPHKKFIAKSRNVVILMLVAGFGAGMFGLGRSEFINGEQLKKNAELIQVYDRPIWAKKGTVYDRNLKELSKTVTGINVELNSIASLRKTLIKKVSERHDLAIDEIENICKAFADNPEGFELLSSKAQGVEIEVLSLLNNDLDFEAKDVYDAILKNKSKIIIKERLTLEEKEKVEALRGKEEVQERILSKKDKLKNRIYTLMGLDEKVKSQSYVKHPYAQYINITNSDYRVAPYKSLASKLIGFELDSSSGYGVDGNLKELLKGSPGKVVTFVNIENEAIPGTPNHKIEPIMNNLVLTLDVEIQRILENELKLLLEESKGYTAMGIAMDPKTGAILAMASIPDYDPNDRYNIIYESLTERNESLMNAREEQWQNQITSWTYEPGSVFKPFITAAALEEKLWSENETYTCTGSIKVADRTISCHKHSGHGTQTLEQALANSCNPFYISVGQRLGIDTFNRYFEAFGFSQKTGFELYEANPIYRSFDKMTKIDLATSSFGQAFSVTPLQLVTGICSIANGGKLMQPYIVDSVIDSLGNTVSKTQPIVRRQVISESTATRVTQMMESVVKWGSGGKSYVPGYHVAGKTGTSEKLNEKVQGLENPYVVSFVGFAPANDPKIAVLMAVDKPVGGLGGGALVAPVVGKVIEKSLRYMNVEPVYTAQELEALKKSEEALPNN